MKQTTTCRNCNRPVRVKNRVAARIIKLHNVRPLCEACKNGVTRFEIELPY